MPLVYYLSTIILNLIAGLNNRKNIIQKVLFLLLILFMGILFVGGVNNADYNSYQNAYIYQQGKTLEFGFMLLVNISYKIGLSYSGFLVAIFLLGIFLRLQFIKTYANVNYVFVLFLIFPFVLECVQIRTFLAISIVIFSFKYLFVEKRGNLLKYIICIIIASTVHKLSVLFFLFIIIKSKNIRRLMKIVIPITVFVIIYLAYNKFSVSILLDLFSLVEETKADVYAKGGFSLTYILNIFYVTINIIFSYWSIRLQKDRIDCDLKVNKQIEFSKKILYINIILFICSPLYLAASIIFRVPRSMYIINYILFDITRTSIKKGTKTSYLYNVVILAYIILVFIMELYLQRYLVVLHPILFENIFI